MSQESRKSNKNASEFKTILVNNFSEVEKSCKLLSDAGYEVFSIVGLITSQILITGRK